MRKEKGWSQKQTKETLGGMSVHKMCMHKREKGGALLLHSISDMVKQLLKKWPLVDMLVLYGS